jgi:hypothetical protein
LMQASRLGGEAVILSIKNLWMQHTLSANDSRDTSAIMAAPQPRDFIIVL